MQDYTINSVHVQDVTGMDAGGNATITKRVTYYVGKNGPFVLNYAHGEYNAERVTRDMEAEVSTLRAIAGAGA